VAVNKPAGMVIHAGAGIHSGTLVNALLHHFGQLSSVGGALRPGIVHRLDRYTSGVVLAARTDAAHRALAAQFARHQVDKEYRALAHGRFSHPQGRIQKPITRDPRRRTRMTARLAYGRAAVTEYRVLDQFAGFAYLQVRIAIAGDRLYGAPARIPGLPLLGRYFLHAWRIRFRSPSTGRPVTVEAPLPEELERWMARLAAIES